MGVSETGHVWEDIERGRDGFHGAEIHRLRQKGL